MARILILALATAAFTLNAYADPVPGAGDVERAFAMGWSSFDQPIEAGTRDANGNRVVINGRIEVEGTLTGGLMDGYIGGEGGSAQAIANQLNVVTQGDWNTVIVDSTQINTGDVTAISGAQ